MANMESGFGWYYPPGTPGPRSEYGVFRCKDCGYEVAGKCIHDLGAVDIVTDGNVSDVGECPNCGFEGSAMEFEETMEPYSPQYDRHEDIY